MALTDGVGRALDELLTPARRLGSVLMRPTGASRNPLTYGINVISSLTGRSLESELRDRVVVITGASSGIGEATARRLGPHAGAVILVARREPELQALAASIGESGGRAFAYPCDLTDLTATAALAKAVEAEHGSVDVLVNNAGRSIRRSLTLSYERMHDFERTMELNYFAPVRLMLSLLPGMRERGYGRIVNVSTAGTQFRPPRFGAYVASKAALDMLCDTWQAETRRDNVTFTTVHMGLVRTPMIEATSIYDRFPTISADDAAAIIANAVVNHPRRVSSAIGELAAFADALEPALLDQVRSYAFSLFADSSAARGDADRTHDAPVDARGRLLAELTPGVHW